MNTPNYPLPEATHPRRCLCASCAVAPPSALPLPVVIFYSDVAAGLRAVQLLVDLAGQACDEIDFEPRLWRISLLEEPRYLESAAADVAAAGIILLAAKPDCCCATLQDWLARCLEARRDDPPALVALGDGDGGAGEEEWLRWNELCPNDSFFAVSPTPQRLLLPT